MPDLQEYVKRLEDAILKAPHNQYCHAKRWIPGDCTCYKKTLLAKLDN